MTIMATSAYLSQSQGSAPPASDQEDGVMNLVNTSNSQGYSLPREQVVGLQHKWQLCNFQELIWGAG